MRPLFMIAAITGLLGMASVTHAAEMPDAVIGRWVSSTVSATTYWGDNGQFLGNGHGTAQFYDFKSDGTFKYFMYMEIRTGTFVSKVSTSCEGRVKFAAHKFSLSPTKGHYHSEIGSTVKDREMTDEDLKRMTKTYAWKMSKTSDGKPLFVVPFEDGSKEEFKVAEDAPPGETKKP